MPKTTPARAAAPADQYPKLERTRLSMPLPDFERLRALKARLKALDRRTRKNELVRAGLHLLCGLDDEALLQAVDQLPATKPPKAPKQPKAKSREASRQRAARPAPVPTARAKPRVAQSSDRQRRRAASED